MRKGSKKTQVIPGAEKQPKKYKHFDKVIENVYSQSPWVDWYKKKIGLG